MQYYNTDDIYNIIKLPMPIIRIIYNYIDPKLVCLISERVASMNLLNDNVSNLTYQYTFNIYSYTILDYHDAKFINDLYNKVYDKILATLYTWNHNIKVILFDISTYKNTNTVTHHDLIRCSINHWYYPFKQHKILHQLNLPDDILAAIKIMQSIINMADNYFNIYGKTMSVDNIYELLESKSEITQNFSLLTNGHSVIYQHVSQPRCKWVFTKGVRKGEVCNAISTPNNPNRCRLCINKKGKV